MTGYLKALWELIFPPTCAACGGELGSGESVICTACRWDMPLTYYWLTEENYAVELLAGRFPFQQACALFFFDHASRYRDMIHRMKYQGRRDVARMSGSILGAMLAQSTLYSSVEVVVPVPLHWSRRMKRGYNQSEELSHSIGIQMGLPTLVNALKRTKKTKTQARKGNRDERWKNVYNAFTVADAAALNGKHILIIDDVLTTGATIEALAQAVLNACHDVTISVATVAVVKRTIRH